MTRLGQHDATALTAPPECFGYRRSSRKAGGAQVAGIRPSWPSSSVVTRLPAGRQPGLARRPSAASVMVQANTAEREDQRLAERWFSREAALSYASERSASSRRIQERDGRVIARSADARTSSRASASAPCGNARSGCKGTTRSQPRPCDLALSRPGRSVRLISCATRRSVAIVCRVLVRAHLFKRGASEDP